jgi:transcriptional regulator with XRE-family HTH domain
MTFKELLKSNDFTQLRLSKRLAKMGICKYRQQISEWVCGIRTPDLEIAVKIAEILNCPLDVVANSLLRKGGN